jgi:hypothetical protein
LYLRTCHVQQNSNLHRRCCCYLQSHNSHCSWGHFCFEGEDNVLEFVSTDLPSSE